MDALGIRRLEQLPDGTVRQQSPITGTVVWTVPGRSRRPLPSPIPPGRPLGHGQPRPTCAFCPERALETPPERARLMLAVEAAENGATPWRIERHVPAEPVAREAADFRRIPNLFEILPLEYWRANHGYEVPDDAVMRLRDYAGTPAGRTHLIDLSRTRLAATGASPEQVAAEPDDALLARALGWFASTHDVIVARRHLVDDATSDDALCSSGDLSPDEHHAFVAFTVDALGDLATAHPFVRYVSVFQNWLRPAGASFDHLHKQLVAIDEHGPLMARTMDLLDADPQLFNTAVADPAARERLVIAENGQAIALAGVGHRYPTIEIYATGAVTTPWQVDPTAMRAMSDLLHACHAATGRLVPTNEEWHYQPVGTAQPQPWRINLKWRISTLAGFEGGTKINVNTISPFTLRERMVLRLGELRAEGRIAPIAIGDECAHRSGVLRYATG